MITSLEIYFMIQLNLYEACTSLFRHLHEAPYYTILLVLYKFVAVEAVSSLICFKVKSLFCCNLQIMKIISKINHMAQNC